MFRPLTQKSLEGSEQQKKLSRESEDENLVPSQVLSELSVLPQCLDVYLPPELVNAPLEDVDPFYKRRKTFIVINKARRVFRFDASNAFWVLGPLSPPRRLAICTLTHSLFALVMGCVVLATCLFMIMPRTPLVDTVLLTLTVVYTVEVVVKVTARGFVLRPFTYLRDPWNWLDFILTTLAYTPLGPDVAGFTALRGLRLLRALAFTNHAPGMKMIYLTIKESMKNLASVMVFVAFFIFLFALSGLLHFMGILTQTCVANFPMDGSGENWASFVSNSTNWLEMSVCGNSSGSGACPEGYTCLQGYGPNPNYGFTSFDTFGWASLSAIQLLTQDYWENLYQLVLRAGGPWQTLSFVAAIFFGSYYLQALILIVVVGTYTKEQWRAASEEEEALVMAEYVEDLRRNANGDRKNSCTRQESLKIHSDAHKHLPYVDDSNPTTRLTTPDTEEDISKLNDPFDNAGNRKKSNASSKITNFLCVWDCCAPWEKLRKIIALIILDPFVFVFLALCIVVDVVLMALYHHNMGVDLYVALASANYFFTITFALEVTLKIIALHPKHYFQEKWNVFEFIVITISVLELAFGCAMVLSVLRTFRLLRLIKSVQIRAWSTLNSLLAIMEAALSDLVNLSLVFFIVVTVFGTLGMHLYGKNYIDNIERFPDGDLPRWNFTDFLHSFMIVFRVLCGEWIESLWDCMLVGDVSCMPFFLSLVFFGRYVIFNLFLALLLRNVVSQMYYSYSSRDEKFEQVFQRIKSFFTKRTDQVSNQTGDEEQGTSSLAWAAADVNHRSWQSHLNACDETPDEVTSEKEMKDERGSVVENVEEDSPHQKGSKWHCSCFRKETKSEKEKSLANGDLSTEDVIGDVKDSERGRFSFVETKYFTIPVGVVIVISSLALALEDVHLQHRPKLQYILYILDVTIVIVFFIEMLVRVLHLGLRIFFRRPLCLLDLLVVVCCFTHLATPLFGCQVIRVLKVVRILRLLRLIQSKKGMDVVTNTLSRGIPSICCALFLCLIIWLAFALLGVRLFAGKYFKCVDDNGITLSYETAPDFNTCMDKNYTWQKSEMNFDHLGNAYLSLLQVATFKGWIEIMNDAIDSRGVNQQPIRETNIYMYLYFELFIMICSFFTMTVFVAVTFANYNKQAKGANGHRDYFMTADQLTAYVAREKINSCKPVKAIPPPQWRLQQKIYEMVQSREFEMIFMLMICLNMLALSMDHYQLSQPFANALDYITLIFLVIFTAECALKMLAFRHHYFKGPWTLFDLSIVLLSILALVLPDYIISIATLSLLRIIRLAKIGELLRQLKCAKKIRRLLSVTSACFPALFNIVLLLFVVIFIFAVFGMAFFMHVKEKSGLDDVFNFRTFGQSVIVLLQVSTLAGWDGVLSAITNEQECRPEECGNSILGIAFLLSYLVVTYLIIVMYIPAVSWYHSKINEEQEESITDEDCAMFISAWQQFDPNASNYIQYTQLSDFLDTLEPPLQIPKPNKFKIITLDIPICKDERVSFTDVFNSVAEDVFKRKGMIIYDELDTNQCPNQPDYERISSTLWRQRETHNAQVIQKWWRSRKNPRYLGLSAHDEKPKARQSSVEVDTDGITTKNGHNTKLHNRTPTFNSHSHIADL